MNFNENKKEINVQKQSLISIIYQGNLDLLKELYKNENLKREDIILNHVFHFACQCGYLEICKWFFETFEITKKEASKDNNIAFRWACDYGRLDVCKWLCNTFTLTKKEFNEIKTQLFQSAIGTQKYNILFFLFETFKLTEEDIENVTYTLTEGEKEILMMCLTPLGSYAKPAK